MKRETCSFLSIELLFSSMLGAFKMMTPWALYKNPVMFVTYMAALLTTCYLIYYEVPSIFEIQITLWLWITVFFANFAEAIAESRGKAQANSLRKTQIEAFTWRLEDGQKIKTASSDIRKGDVIFCKAGETIPADGDVIEGVATVDESAITGESAPVIRESGGDRSAVTAGTTVVSDHLTIRVVSEAGNSFLDKMIQLIEGAKRKATPNEVALNIVLMALTILFIFTVISVKFSSLYSGANVPFPVLAALLICLIPTTISGLLSAVGIAGMDRLIRKNVIAKSGRAVEAAGDIDLLILDKTGTITIGNRMAHKFLPVKGKSEKELAEVAQLASLSDETPEGRSIVVLAKNQFGLRAKNLETEHSHFIPFSAKTRMSGVDYKGSGGEVIRSIRKGAKDSIKGYVTSLGGVFPEEIDELVEMISRQGGTPLVVSDKERVVGVIYLKDIIKGGIKERFEHMRKMGIRTLMVTGDNPLTAAAIAAEAGVDDYVAEATPEIKLDLIHREQQAGRLVAMTGDGTNDAPALAQADVGVAMNTGTQASREAGNMVDLDSNPSKLIDIVEIGKQLLMTRGALTTFSIANDVAKYFAILPALFGGLYQEGFQTGPLSSLNIMNLHSPQSAILSALIFNAIIIVALIPLALRGIKYGAESAHTLLRNNLLIWGLGGLVVPFIGIKLIDLSIQSWKALT